MKPREWWKRKRFSKKNLGRLIHISGKLYFCGQFVKTKVLFFTMSKQSKQIKQPKSQSSNVNDTLAKSEAIITKYKKPLLIAVIAVVVIVGGIFAYIYGYAKPREEKAQELLGVVMQKYVMVEDYETSLKGDGKITGLLAIADKYSSTNAGNLAKYEAGVCYFSMGQTQEAIKLLEKFKTKGDNTISAQALNVLANCYATNNQLDQAVKTFKKAAKATKVPALCSEYLFEAGQLLEAQGKNDEALAVYEQIKKDYPNAPICTRSVRGNVVMDPMIDKYIEHLK